MASTDWSRVSPTAHYTGYVWFHHGLSHEALVSPLGRRLYRLLWPANLAFAQLWRRPNLEMMLLARHRIIDHLLGAAIDRGEVGQVLELAAGFSPRGFRFARRFPGLRYIEADLPAQAAAKRELLDGAGLRGGDHEVRACDALAEAGPGSLEELFASLDPRQGLAVITEGLLNYFPRPAVQSLWRRLGAGLARFPVGLYLSDLNLAADARGVHAAEIFRQLLQLFSRGGVYLHFDDATDAERALAAAGFVAPKLWRPAELPALALPLPDRGHLVRVIEARREG